MEANLAALEQRDPASEALARYRTIAQVLSGRGDAAAGEGVVWVKQLCRELQIPPLRTYGVADGDIAVLVEKAARASSMKANPIVLTAAELTSVLKAAI
jgi:alcohol dehydrogenase class IV